LECPGSPGRFLFCAYSRGAIGTMVTAGGFAGAEVAGIAGRRSALAGAAG
jgi:hypothetical protein